MSQTRPNKIITITNDEVYDLATHQARMADSTNVTVKVGSTAERDALPPALLTPGTKVIVTDDTTMPEQKWNGSKWVQFIYAEATGSILVQPSQAWGSGQLTLNQTNSTDPAFVTFPVADCIQFTAPGLYSMSAHVRLTTGTVAAFAKGTIQDANGNSVYGQEYPHSSASEFVIAAPVIYFPTAGGRVFLKYYQTSGTQQTWSTIARISKIG
ncbi:hypothetical protein [Arthrobacter sp. B3I4]|uniref:hypothetical protein n=1 Tax=Arthrobacter sp. B3I4 TaxID=3042267 RepID=UPI00277F46E7|nr:hypothetical protein [Arthrobacter sp. B3I4]MDQ0756064.1 hypothetical protein [Arthrobacter sp. B3I4]